MVYVPSFKEENKRKKAPDLVKYWFFIFLQVKKKPFEEEIGVGYNIFRKYFCD
jgi:hypothetical protein